MTDLLAVELRRLLARPLVRAVGVVLLVALVAAPPLVAWAFDERARIERDADLERCVQAREPKVRDGVTVPTIPEAVAVPAERARRCEQAIPPRDGTFRLVDVGDVLRPLGVLLVIGAFMIGASAVGADWQAGFVPTLLTWEGRRGRVVVAKVAAVAAVAVLAVAGWQVLLAGVLAAFSAAQEAAGGAGGDWLRATSGLAGRTAAVAGGAAAFGAALALVGRGTAAALAGGLGWVMVLEGVLGANFRPLRPWLVLDNAVVFVKGEFEGGPGGDVPGRTVAAAGLLLAGYLAAVLLAAAAAFRRRDVA